MIASRFASIGWVAGCAGAALCCYLASQSVAAERAAVARVDREIVATTGDIARLNTEIAARGRMGQIERWNREVLALQAPAPGQFVANEVQLASLAGGKSLPLDADVVASKGAVATVAYQPDAAKPATDEAPSATPAAVPAEPMLRRATFVQARTDRLSNVAEAPIVKASLTRPVIAVPTVEDQPALGQRLKADEAKAVAPPHKDAPAVARKPSVAGKDAPAKDAHDKKPVVARAEPKKDKIEKAPTDRKVVATADHKASVERKALAEKPEKAKGKPAPKLTVARAESEKPAVARVVKAPKPLETASLLPSDLGKLIAAEKKSAKASRSAGDR